MMNSTEIELSQGGLDAACELLDLFEAFDAVDDSMYESPGYLNPPIVSIPLKYGLETDNWLQYIQKAAPSTTSKLSSSSGGI